MGVVQWLGGLILEAFGGTFAVRGITTSCDPSTRMPSELFCLKHAMSLLFWPPPRMKSSRNRTVVGDAAHSFTQSATIGRKTALHDRDAGYIRPSACLNIR